MIRIKRFTHRNNFTTRCQEWDEGIVSDACKLFPGVSTIYLNRKICEARNVQSFTEGWRTAGSETVNTLSDILSISPVWSGTVREIGEGEDLCQGTENCQKWAIDLIVLNYTNFTLFCQVSNKRWSGECIRTGRQYIREPFNQGMILFLMASSSCTFISRSEVHPPYRADLPD